MYVTSILMATLRNNLSRPHSLEVTEERYASLAQPKVHASSPDCTYSLSAAPSSPPSLNTSGYLTIFLTLC